MQVCPSLVKFHTSSEWGGAGVGVVGVNLVVADSVVSSVDWPEGELAISSAQCSARIRGGMRGCSTVSTEIPLQDINEKQRRAAIS